jgi:hypothetical protein
MAFDCLFEEGIDEWFESRLTEVGWQAESDLNPHLLELASM